MKGPTADKYYFEDLNRSLRTYKKAIPILLIDLDRLDHNITQLQSLLHPEIDFRIVVKSLPSFALVNYIAAKMETRKLMVFHQPFLSALSTKLDGSWDIVLGKPMPIKTAYYYYANLQTPIGFNPTHQLQWLVDTRRRIEQYIELAKHTGQQIRLNLEIDVGLHRGGFVNRTDLSAALQLILENQKWVDFSGFMGYDPHIVKLPKLLMPPHKAMDLAVAYLPRLHRAAPGQIPETASAQSDFQWSGQSHRFYAL